MKKFLLFTLALLFVVLSSWAQTTPPDGKFTFNPTTGTITGYNAIGEVNIIIPSTIGGVTVTAIGDMAFNNKGLTGVVLPNTLATIGTAAFNANQLSTVVIPNSVTTIGDMAFDQNQLTSVTLGSGLLVIGNQAFSGAMLLTNGNRITSIVIPPSVTTIGSYAFSGNQLTSVIIPASVTALGTPDPYGNSAESAFSHNKLTSVVFEGTNLTNIPTNTFYDNLLTKIEIPFSVTSISQSGFRLNPQLKDITIGANVTLGNFAFTFVDNTSNGFATYYNSNKQAGRYQYISGAWQKTSSYLFVATTGSDANPGTPALPKLTIQAAITAAAAGDVISVAAGTYIEAGQILIGKNLSIVGADKATTIIKPNQNTTGNYDPLSAFIYVAPSTSLVFKNFTIDCEGKLVNHAVQSRGTLDIEDCDVKNVRWAAYYGKGILFLSGTTGNLAKNITLTNIERIGIHVRGSIATPNPVATIDHVTYTGKGNSVPCLDYAVEFGAGGSGTIDYLTATNCTGVAYDGSGSAGILATTYYGTGTGATVTNSTIYNNSLGIAVGYDGADETALIAHDNKIYNNADMNIQNTGTVGVNASCNWFGTATASEVAAKISGTVTYLPYQVSDGGACEGGPVVITRSGSFISVYTTIQAAITAAEASDVITVAAGTYVEAGQIVIDKNLTITGADKTTTIIKTNQSTAGSGDGRGWFLVNAGITFNLSGVTLDGEGYDVAQGIRSLGTTTIDNCKFNRIIFPGYLGMAIAFNGNGGSVNNSQFTNIGRIGVISSLNNTVSITNNTFTGRGIGDHLDYAIVLNGGATGTITGNTISACKGQTPKPGSWTSSAIMITTGFGSGTNATISGNNIYDCTYGITASGHATYGQPVVTATNNQLTDFTYSYTESDTYKSYVPMAIDAYETTSIAATCNWFGTTDYNVILAKVSGVVSFVPYLITDNIVSPECSGGVWPVHNVTKSLYYETIQAAVTAATTGDLIEVAAGTYTENVIIGNSITLQGADRVTTFIDGSNTGVVVTIAANNVRLEGFSIQNSGADLEANAGVVLANVTGCTVINNYIINNVNGVVLMGSTVNSVQDNWINNSARYGIFIGINPASVSTANTISANIIENSGRDGIYVDKGSDSNTIQSNTISSTIGTTEDGEFEGNGIYLWKSGSNTVSDNTIDENAGNGIEISAASNNILTLNMITGNALNGIAIRATTGVASTGNSVTFNNLYYNTLAGILLKSDAAANSGKITDNYIVEDGMGINVESTSINATLWTVTNNSISENSSYAVVNNGTGTLTAECNWWGTDDYNTILSKVNGDVDFVSYLVTDNIVIPVCTGGVWPVHNVTRNLYYQAIQPAITAANASDVIEVAAGTYNESVTVNKANLTIQGAGPSSTYITSTGSTPAITVTSNGATIKNLGITNAAQLVEGIKVNGATSGLTIDYVNFTNLGNGGTNAYGIHFVNSFADLSVSNSQFIGTLLGTASRAMGIFAQSPNTYSNFSVDHCTFQYFFTGIDIRSEINGLTASYNTFGPQEIQDATAAASGIYIGDGPNGNFDIDNISITDNTFTSFARGVYMWDYATGEAIKKVDIKDNTFTNSIYSSPIRLIGRLTSSPESKIEGPIVIDNNTFTQTAQIVNGAGVAMIDLRAGIESATSQIAITNNNISFTGPFTTSTWGMLFRGPITNATISGNTMNGNAAGGSSANMPATSGIVIQSNYTGYGTTSSTADVNILNNDIQGFVNGVAVYNSVSNTYGGIPTGASIGINSNSLTSNTKAIYSGAGETIDASCNWFGTSNGNNIPSLISGNVTYSPWLISDGGACDGTPVIVTLNTLTNVSCPGTSTGAIDINVSGGSGNYSYLWSNAEITQDITALVANTYAVTVTDETYGGTATFSQEVTTTNTVPAVTNPNNLTANTAIGTCAATVTYTVTPSGTPLPTLTYAFTGATTGSGSGSGTGSSFNKGVTTVAITASNGCSPNASVEFTVTVTDNENPTITCVGNQAKDVVTGTCTYIAGATEFNPIAYSDNCPGASIAYALTGATTGSGTNLSGVSFNKGITTVVWTVTDAVANFETCSFTVTVIDPTNATALYVNDGSLTGDTYTYGIGHDVTGDGSKCSPYATITKAIAVASTGGTIYVDAGTYAESVTITKGLDIRGANYGVNPNTGIRGAESVFASASGMNLYVNTTASVQINGFKFANTGGAYDYSLSGTTGTTIVLSNNFWSNSIGGYLPNAVSTTIVNNRLTFSSGADEGFALFGNYNGTTGTVIDVHDNVWLTGQMTGMNVNACSGSIYNNVFDGIAYYGVLLAGNTNISIYQNEFKNIVNPNPAKPEWGSGVRFYPSFTGTSTVHNNSFTSNYRGMVMQSGAILTNVDVHDNSFVGNTTNAILNQSTGILNATCNWWDATAQSAIAAKLNGPVSYTPWLINGTDSEPATPGFQAVPGSCMGSSLSVSLNYKIDAGCPGTNTGSIYITVGGGSGSYTYLWSNGGYTTKNITGIPAGSYNVLVTDAIYGSTGELSTAVVIETTNTAPQVSNPGAIIVSTALNTCAGPATYTVTPSGTPLPTLSYTFAGVTAGSGSGTGSGSIFNKGVTTVTVTASNGCTTNSGSTATFTVTVNDNQAPSITCPGNQAKTSTGAGYTTVGSEFNPTFSDNCPGSTIAYALSGATTGTGTTLAGVAFNSGTTTVAWTVTDDSGNHASCTFDVVVSVSFTISGTLKYANNAQTPLNGIIVTLKKTSDPEFESTWNTSDAGQIGMYQFTGLQPDNYYIELSPVSPIVNTPATLGGWQKWGGVNATDYLIEQRHAAGTTPIPPIPAVKRFAGDVIVPQPTPTILTVDANAVRTAYSTNRPSGFATQKWLFSSTTATSAPPTPSTGLTNIVLGSSNLVINIVAVCAGDVDASYQPPSGPKSAQLPNVEVISRGTIATSPEIALPVRAENDMLMGAISLILDFDASKFEITGVSMPDYGTDAPFFVTDNNMLRIGWASLEPVSVMQGETVLTIHARSLNAASESLQFTLNSDPLSEIADAEGVVLKDARLSIAEMNGATSSDMISVYPNPAKEVLNIEYVMDNDGTFSVELYNTQGAVVCSAVSSDKTAGTYKETLNISHLSPGVFTLRIYNGSNVTNHKVIIN